MWSSFWNFLSVCFLVAHQFHHPYLLCRINVWRVFSCRHLRDGLHHHLLHYLHDGAGQTVPGGELALERKYEFTHTCISVHTIALWWWGFHDQVPLVFSLFAPSGSVPRGNRCSALSHHLSHLCDRWSWGWGSHRWWGETSNAQHQNIPFFLNKSDLLGLYIHHITKLTFSLIGVRSAGWDLICLWFLHNLLGNQGQQTAYSRSHRCMNTLVHLFNMLESTLASKGI